MVRFIKRRKCMKSRSFWKKQQVKHGKVSVERLRAGLLSLFCMLYLFGLRPISFWAYLSWPSYPRCWSSLKFRSRQTRFFTFITLNYGESDDNNHWGTKGRFGGFERGTPSKNCAMIWWWPNSVTATRKWRAKCSPPRRLFRSNLLSKYFRNLSLLQKADPRI